MIYIFDYECIDFADRDGYSYTLSVSVELYGSHPHEDIDLDEAYILNKITNDKVEASTLTPRDQDHICKKIERYCYDHESEFEREHMMDFSDDMYDRMKDDGY